MNREEARAPASTQAQKELAALAAVEFVESGMVVGLGGGSTAAIAIQAIGERIAAGRLADIVGVPCSRAVERLASASGVALTSLDDRPIVDLTIDGADEVTPALDLIKGAGGALLREKIVAQASRREIIVVDAGKLVSRLGRGALPVEVLPFGWKTQMSCIESLGGQASLWLDASGQPRCTDQGNYVLMCAFGRLDDPEALASWLAGRAGIVEHGLFLGLATDIIVGLPAGGTHHLRRGQANSEGERLPWS